MVSKHRYKNITWVDLESPSESEVRDIAEEFNLPRVIANELSHSTLRSKVDFFKKLDLIYLVLHFPITSDKPEFIEQEIDFIIGKNFLISTHYEKIDSIQSFSRVLSGGGIPEEINLGEHAGYIFIELMKELYRNSLEKLEQINDSLKKIETDIFKGRQADAVGIISNTNRKFLNFKQALRHHGEILNSFELTSEEMFGSTFRYSIQTAISEYNRLRNTLDAGKDILDDLRETNDSLLTNKTNQTMKALTAMTSALLPITLITGIFGMSVTDHATIIRNLNDFALVLIFMLVVGLIMFFYFKGRKWL